MFGSGIIFLIQLSKAWLTAFTVAPIYYAIAAISWAYKKTGAAHPMKSSLLQQTVIGACIWCLFSSSTENLLRFISCAWLALGTQSKWVFVACQGKKCSSGRPSLATKTKSVFSPAASGVSSTSVVFNSYRVDLPISHVQSANTVVACPPTIPMSIFLFAKHYSSVMAWFM